MAKHKYNFDVVDFDALKAFAPNAVVTETRTRSVRSVITSLLNAGQTVPGIRLLPDDEDGQTDIADMAHNERNGIGSLGNATHTNPLIDGTLHEQEYQDIPQHLRRSAQ